ncbi:MAG: leucyl/phenylalanyl-tRNA--protein transferase [Spirochaetes bacterium]|nr:leucyl/phenylalanyl-tRNA--protein transferase [Spirochaetota bacterium]
MLNLFFLDDKLVFPPVETATKEGIIAIGGDLSVKRLILAYSSGIFPWYSETEPILWWSPDPRFVLFPQNIKISKSLKKFNKKNIYKITFDKDFENVINMCSKLRSKKGTWLTNEMIEAYIALHNEGYAHSVEAWHNNKLAGGLYGVSLGRCFFGESMFFIMENASKVCLITLAETLLKKEFLFIDSQVYTRHLENFGACNISRNDYIDLLKKGLDFQTFKGSWSEIMK